MSTVVQTDFTDADGTALEDHTPTAVGTSFVKHEDAAGGSAEINHENRLRIAVEDTLVVYYASDAPASANQTAAATLLRYLIPTATVYPSVHVRLSTTELTSYFAQVNAGALSTALYLFKQVNGTPTQLGTEHTFTPTNGVPFAVEISATDDGADVDLVVSLDGTPVVTQTDSSSPITAAGRIGLGHYAENAADIGDSVGVVFEDFLGEDDGGGPPPSSDAARLVGGKLTNTILVGGGLVG
jgi:hypothetical protein